MTSSQDRKPSPVPATVPSMRRVGGVRSAAVLLAGALALTAAGCGATVTKHGHHMRATDVQQIQPGMGQDEVRLALGTPATTSRTQTGETFYYISSTTKQQAFFKPREIDRKVLAVYFSPLGSVQRVANYGLRDGKVFDLISRKTPSANDAEGSLLQELFRNIGRQRIAEES